MDALSSSQLYDMCNLSLSYDLYVEWLKYWDEANVAVAARRGTMEDLGLILLMMGNTAPDRPIGHTIYYFVLSTDIT